MTLTLASRQIAGIAAATLLLLGTYVLGASRNHADAAAEPAGAASLPGAGPGTAPSAITVTGTGRVTGTPDTLRVDLGVSVTGKTVNQALTAASDKAAAVQDSLRGNGVAAKDLQTTGLNIQPGDESGQGGRSSLRGYQVDESLSAALRNLNTAGAVISAAAAAGGQATRIDGVSLDLEDTGPLLAGARTDAFAQARSKAGQYARAAGLSVGRVVSIQEAVQAPEPQSYAYPAASARNMASVPVQAGSQELAVTVTVTFTVS